MTWPGEKQRHAMSARGVTSAQSNTQMPLPKMNRPLDMRVHLQQYILNVNDKLKKEGSILRLYVWEGKMDVQELTNKMLGTLSFEIKVEHKDKYLKPDYSIHDTIMVQPNKEFYMLLNNEAKRMNFDKSSTNKDKYIEWNNTSRIGWIRLSVTKVVNK